MKSESDLFKGVRKTSSEEEASAAASSPNINTVSSLLEDATRFEFGPVAYFILNKSFVIEDANQRSSFILGLKREQLLGRRVIDFILPRHHERFYRCFNYSDNTVQRSCELKMLRSDQEEIYVQFDCAAEVSKDETIRYKIAAIDISRRKAAEQALRESEVRFRSLFENSPDAIFLTEPEGKILFANPAACAMFGMSEAEFRQTGRNGIIDPEDPRHELATMERERTGRLIKTELNYIRRNGQRFPAEVDAVTMPGTSLRSFVILRDITQRKKVEEDLRTSEERFRAFVLITNDILYSMSPDWRELRIILSKNLIRTKTEVTRDWIGKYIYPEDRQRVHAAVKEVIKNRTPFRFEHRICREDGSVSWVMSSAVPLMNERGEVVEWFGAAIDITRRKEWEQQLRTARNELELRVQERTEELNRTNRTLRMISECNHLLLRITDEQELMDETCRIAVEIGGYRMAWVGYAENDLNRIIRPAASAGFTADFFQGAIFSWAENEEGEGPTGTCIRTAKVRIANDYQEESEPARCRLDALRCGYRSSIALPLINAGSALGALTIYSDRPNAFDPEQGSLLRGLADDLSFGIMVLRTRFERDHARKTAEARFAQLQALSIELLESEHRERQRLAKVLHDHLQQLLVGAKFEAGAIGRKIAGKGLKDGLEELQRTLDEAIQASRSLSAELVPPVLYEKGLRGGLEWLARQFQTKHGMVVEISADRAFEPETEQVRLFLYESVRELLLNIVKHAQATQAQIHLDAKDQNIEIMVADNGIGFDPAKVSQTSAGFGLFTIRERLDYLGGRMEIDAAPGRGSRFILIAPARQLSTINVAAPKRAESPAGRQEHKIRVLIADDHAVLRQGLSKVLQEYSDIEVVGEADDGREAVQMTRQTKPDIVLMDVSMPVVSGVDATRQIISECPGTRVIGLSMHEESETETSMRRAGAIGYVKKGHRAEELVSVIRIARPEVQSHA